MEQNYGKCYRDWEVKIAMKLVGKFQKKWKCLRVENSNEIVNECLIHWYSVRHKYDPARKSSQEAFMSKIVENKLQNIVKKISIENRKRVYAEDALVLMDEIAARVQNQIDPVLRAGLKIDLSKAFQKLTREQRKLCRLLQQGLDINEASGHFKRHRSNVYREALRIRKIFEKEGLKDYLKF